MLGSMALLSNKKRKNRLITNTDSGGRGELAWCPNFFVWDCWLFNFRVQFILCKFCRQCFAVLDKAWVSDMDGQGIYYQDFVFYLFYDFKILIRFILFYLAIAERKAQRKRFSKEKGKDVFKNF